jgi:creatinine amidohydrolase
MMVTGCAGQAAPRGVELAKLSWVEAERVLRPEAVVVIPLGAALKEHGPHLPLDNDRHLERWLSRQVLRAADVVMVPAVPYHHYPGFLEYPGTISLRLETARDLIVDLVRSLARHGPRRFYVLNTGVSTVKALGPAAEVLSREGLLLRYTDLHVALGPARQRLLRQEGGTHADEAETSMMLELAPGVVRMDRAVKDYRPDTGPGLTRRADNRASTYSPTGVWGDPTLATRAKGRELLRAYVDAVLVDLQALRAAPLPPVLPAPRSTASP